MVYVQSGLTSVWNPRVDKPALFFLDQRVIVTTSIHVTVGAVLADKPIPQGVASRNINSIYLR